MDMRYKLFAVVNETITEEGMEIIRLRERGWSIKKLATRFGCKTVYPVREFIKQHRPDLLGKRACLVTEFTPAQIEEIITLRKTNTLDTVASHMRCQSGHIRRVIARYAPELEGVWVTSSGNYNYKIPRDDLPNVLAERRAGKTYEEIAKPRGVSRERIRQILKRDEPALTGYMEGHCRSGTCSGCGQTNTPGGFTEFYSHHAAKTGHMLCKNCYPTFVVYQRAMKRAMVYLERYQYILAALSKGVKAYEIGYMWEGKPIEGIKYKSSPTSQHIWSARIRGLYKPAIQRLKQLEQEYPWLRGYYEQKYYQSGLDDNQTASPESPSGPRTETKGDHSDA